MKAKKFKAEIVPGHKESAVEVPFDPTQVWRTNPQSLWHGRRGHTVKGMLNGKEFKGVIVPRQRKFYLLIDKELERDAGVAPGDVVEVALEASASAKS
ncbi:MAG: DUF1905 domain-containing protein [bacterium]